MAFTASAVQQDERGRLYMEVTNTDTGISHIKYLTPDNSGIPRVTQFDLRSAKGHLWVLQNGRLVPQKCRTDTCTVCTSHHNTESMAV